MDVDDATGRFGPLRKFGRLNRRLITRNIARLPGTAGWLIGSILDFAIDDVCVLCRGRGSRPDSTGPARSITKPVCHRSLFGTLEIKNHPVCPACAGRLPVAQAAGELGRRVGAHTIVTLRGDVFPGASPPGVGDSVSSSGQPVRVLSPYMVDDNILQIVHLIKFGRYEALALPVAEAILWAIGEFGPASVRRGIVVPVPMDLRGLKRRGFNQSERFARRIADVLDLPLETDILRKTGRTRPQSQTRTEDRASNVRGAFACGVDLAGREALLVDDLVTTGATAAAAAAALLAAGAGSVTVVCFGRAL